MADKDKKTPEEEDEEAGQEAAHKAQLKVAEEAMDLKKEQDAAAGNYDSSAHDNPTVRKAMVEAGKKARRDGEGESRNRRLMRQLYDNPRSK